MRMLGLLCAVALLAGCDNSSSGEDVYSGETFKRSTFEVTLYEYDSLTALRTKAKQLDAQPKVGNELMAFGIVSLTQPKCSVHVLRPEIVSGRKYWGHELIHCSRGNWHE